MFQNLQNNSSQVRRYKVVADRLIEAIHQGEYAIGHRLPSERELSKKFDISRQTIRQAAVALEVLGYLEIKVGSGTYYVKNVEKKWDGILDCRSDDIFGMRLHFEAEAAALAAINISNIDIDRLFELGTCTDQHDPCHAQLAETDHRFHSLVAEATNNSLVEKYVIGALDLHRDHAQKIAKFALQRPAIMRLLRDEHMAIADALRSRDSTAARAAMTSHIETTISLLQ